MTTEEKIKQFVEKQLQPCKMEHKSISSVVEVLEHQRDNNIVEMVVSTFENDMDYPNNRTFFVEECYVDGIVNLLRFLSNNAYEEDIATLLSDYFLSGGYEFSNICLNGRWLSGVLGYIGYTDKDIETLYKSALKTLNIIELGIFDFIVQLVNGETDIGTPFYIDNDIRNIVERVGDAFDNEMFISIEEKITLVSFVYELFVPSISEYQTRQVHDILVKKII